MAGRMRMRRAGLKREWTRRKRTKKTRNRCTSLLLHLLLPHLLVHPFRTRHQPLHCRPACAAGCLGWRRGRRPRGAGRARSAPRAAQSAARGQSRPTPTRPRARPACSSACSGPSPARKSDIREPHLQSGWVRASHPLHRSSLEPRRRTVRDFPGSTPAWTTRRPRGRAAVTSSISASLAALSTAASPGWETARTREAPRCVTAETGSNSKRAHVGVASRYRRSSSPIARDRR